MSFFFFFKQKTAYEMRISDWSSDVCSSDLFWRLGHVRKGMLAAGAHWDKTIRYIVIQYRRKAISTRRHGKSAGRELRIPLLGSSGVVVLECTVCGRDHGRSRNTNTIIQGNEGPTTQAS